MLSDRNGLDNEHVTNLLGIDISNKDILEKQNRKYLEKYTYKTLNKQTDICQNPMIKYIFWLENCILIY